MALGLALSVLIGVALGFFGGGGSILTVPLLVYVFGLPPKEAIASSLLVVAAASVFGAGQHWRMGNVHWRAGAVFGASSVLGAYAGGRASVWLDPGFLLLLFGAMMMLTATAMWRGRRDDRERTTAAASPPRLALQGVAVGSFTGLVGAGGGFLIVPALALWAGLPMTAAVGTSLAIIVVNTSAAFLGYASHVRVDFGLIAAVSAAAIGGSFGGTWLARRVDAEQVRRAFAAFVLAMAAVILVRESAAVVTAAGDALPRTLPQLAFALAMLAIGIVSGRASRSATRQREELLYAEGGGI